MKTSDKTTQHHNPAELAKATEALYQETDRMPDYWELLGYTDIREVIPNYWCGIYRYLSTYGVCIGLDASGHQGRFCFDTYLNAQLFLRDWKGFELPVVGDDGCTAVKVPEGLTVIGFK